LDRVNIHMDMESTKAHLDEVAGQIYAAVELDTLVSHVYVEVTVSRAEAAVAFDDPGVGRG
jgi:hypothetical protein